MTLTISLFCISNIYEGTCEMTADRRRGNIIPTPAAAPKEVQLAEEAPEGEESEGEPAATGESPTVEEPTLLAADKERLPRLLVRLLLKGEPSPPPNAAALTGDSPAKEFRLLLEGGR